MKATSCGRVARRLVFGLSRELIARSRPLVRGFSIAWLVGALSLSAACPAEAAPDECMGTAADGTAKCTAPLISGQQYGICIQTGFDYPDNAMDRCYVRLVGRDVPLTSEGQVTAIINCLPPETYGAGTPSGSVSLAWASEGNTIVDNNLCWTITATSRYGVEMHGWAKVDAAALNYGWNVIARRDRTAVCPHGYSPRGADSQYPDYCVKPACLKCERVGNPLSIATGEKKVFEDDYAVAGSSPLRFSRAFSNVGHYRPVLNGSPMTPGFGDFWRHSYSARLLPEGNQLWATVLRPDGTEQHFRPNGKEVLNTGGKAGDRLSRDGSNNWILRSMSGRMEVFSPDGKLTKLVDITGRTQTLTYSDATTPASVAPYAGLLTAVSDQFGRTLHFSYDTFGALRTMTDAAGQSYSYTFDSNQMLTKVDYPNSTSRTYVYNEAGPSGTTGGPYAISGIFDENGARYATYRYGDASTPDSTEHGVGAQKFLRQPNGSNSQGSVISVTDPLGTVRNYTVASIGGIDRVVSQAQPPGAGSTTSSDAKQFDANGNVISRDNFNGTRTCYAFDAVTNQETVRVEGLSNTQVCASVTAAGTTLPAGSKKTTSTWHPDWELKTSISEPGRRTTSVYNGQPDPFASNTPAKCAPDTALLPDGKPIAVLCKQVEQATTDTDGHLGAAAALQTSVAARTTAWTYNSAGQVLTGTDPSNNVTTNTYYAVATADYSIGDLYTVRNAKSQLTTFKKYNKHGQVLEVADPNGVSTLYTYDARLRMLTSSIGTEKTTYTYDPAGLLVRVTFPDGSYVGYEYDEAHRRKAEFDSKGNRRDYTLDAQGNVTAERVTDANGNLARTLTRAYDALNRLQTITGGAQ